MGFSENTGQRINHVDVPPGAPNVKPFLQYRANATPCINYVRPTGLTYVLSMYYQILDMSGRPAPRALLDRGVALPRAHVDEGGRRADAQRAEQEFVVLRRVDPEQHQVGRVRHPAEGHHA